MDRRIAAYFAQFQIPKEAQDALKELLGELFAEVRAPTSPPWLTSSDDSLNEREEFSQTLNDPEQGQALKEALEERLYAFGDATLEMPTLGAQQPSTFSEQPTDESLQPFAAIDQELDAWQEESEASASWKPEEEHKSKVRTISSSPSLSGTAVTSAGHATLMRPLPPEERYEDLGFLGEGGMGEVRRVRDKQLKRVVAMKVIRKELVDEFSLSIRFIEEAQATAQLQHPGIIPLHDLGQLKDGRYYFTMKEIKGKTLEVVIRELHQVSRPAGRWCKTEDGWTFRRVIDAFRDVCEAVGYAHSRGVIHRDLKPENVMLGPHGEVLVLDWGLVKVKGRDEKQRGWRHQTQDIVITDRSMEEEYVTMIGAITGTPTYMSPEQARGSQQLDARTDVYALGAVLYEILSGEPPFVGEEHDEVLAQVLAGPPPQLKSKAERELETTWEGAKRGDENVLPLAEELIEICNTAMARDPRERYPDATALAQAVAEWLEGDQKRERALELLKEANAKLIEIDALREKARTLRLQAKQMLEQVEDWESEEAKQKGWALEDEALRMEREVTRGAQEMELALQGALVHDPFLVEARLALAASYKRQHQEAELQGKEHERIRAEQMLFNHIQAIPVAHPEFKVYLSYLQGNGALTLVTDPPGAEVFLYRYVEQNRRLIPIRGRSLDHTPLLRQSMPMGSYLLVLQKEGHQTVRYPIQIQRQEHWNGTPPGEQHPEAIKLPKLSEIGPDECYIPGGWFWSGGDPNAIHGLPRRRLWLDSFVIQRFPVTHEKYLFFLNSLLQEGREEEALQFAPRQFAEGGKEGALLYGRDQEGLFVPRPLSPKNFLELPVTLVTLAGARAYARWYTHQSGQMWCLPDEMEWEKAARGVDGRFFPWGNWGDPSWLCINNSRKGEAMIDIVDSWPIDESPYGVRGMAGNTKDWCANPYRVEGPRQQEISARTLSMSETGTLRGFDSPFHDGFDDESSAHTLRGGSWSEGLVRARLASRRGGNPNNRYDNVSFRLIRYC